MGSAGCEDAYPTRCHFSRLWHASKPRNIHILYLLESPVSQVQTFAELDVAGAPFHYSDVPEWAALLSNVRRYARSYSWTALYPALAFFAAILGFNLFGEGVRQLIEDVRLRLPRLVNRYTVGFVALALLLII